MLFRAVVEGVPAQVFGVESLGVSGRHGDEQGGDVTAAGGEDRRDLV